MLNRSPPFFKAPIMPPPLRDFGQWATCPSPHFINFRDKKYTQPLMIMDRKLHSLTEYVNRTVPNSSGQFRKQWSGFGVKAPSFAGFTECTCKSVMETVFESQELRIQSEDNVLLRGGVFFAVPCSSEFGCEGQETPVCKTLSLSPVRSRSFFAEWLQITHFPTESHKCQRTPLIWPYQLDQLPHTECG